MPALYAMEGACKRPRAMSSIEAFIDVENSNLVISPQCWREMLSYIPSMTTAAGNAIHMLSVNYIPYSGLQNKISREIGRMAYALDVWRN